ncbi:hypothetical protein LCGC14_2917650 [marine sediment metagenome]|uniref:Uncharacterized protein n=1 Tax=marine sediment metagenome TaxID=412755 RepID=A0A0F8XQ15_9ZZZZ
MAAYNKFDDFVEQLCLKKHELNADLVKVFLSNEQPLTTDTIKTDIADIAAGNGYTAGGDDVTNTLSVATGTVTMVAVDVVFTASGGTIGPFQFVVAYNDTLAGPVDALISWWDRGAALTLQDGESFTVDFQGNKIFDLS